MTESIEEVSRRLEAEKASAGMDPNQFHLILEVGRGKELANQAKFDEALRVCARCMVRQECRMIEKTINPFNGGGLRIFGGEVLGLARRQERLYKKTIDHLVDELVS